MRWSIIRLIWHRELRDQLRDRRTLFMIAGLPLLLYPLLGFAVIRFAQGFASQPSVVGIARVPHTPDDFPRRQPPEAGLHPAPALTWLMLAPGAPTFAPDRILGAAALADAGYQTLDYPLLVQDGQLTGPAAGRPVGLFGVEGPLKIEFVDAPADALRDKKIDLLL